MCSNACGVCGLLFVRLWQGYFAPKQQSTIGAFFLTKKLVLPDQTQCKLQIWDTAGQERCVFCCFAWRRPVLKSVMAD
jgi:hypothetical protein